MAVAHIQCTRGLNVAGVMATRFKCGRNLLIDKYKEAQVVNGGFQIYNVS